MIGCSRDEKRRVSFDREAEERASTRLTRRIVSTVPERRLHAPPKLYHNLVGTRYRRESLRVGVFESLQSEKAESNDGQKLSRRGRSTRELTRICLIKAPTCFERYFSMARPPGGMVCEDRRWARREVRVEMIPMRWSVAS